MKIEMTLMPLPVTLKADTIGTLARKILEESDQAKILGVTSRGIFLLIPSNKVVFLSFETFRSPLTLNLPARPHLSHTRPGMPADLLPGEIVFPKDNLRIRYTDAEPWAPSFPSAKLLSKIEVNQNFRAIAAHLDSSAGFAPILQVIAGRLEP
jgi:hypothetical protein